MFSLRILLFFCIVLTCKCENYTQLCYDNKQFKNVNNLIKIEKAATLSAAKHIRENGYPVEIHEVTTDDGYILSMQRIPHGLTNKRRDNAQPVLILHGLGSSSEPLTIEFIYMLANKGYDVWLGNLRSSFENTRHIHYSQSQSKFWKFGLDEIGLIDTPAMIDYILNTTKQTQLSAVISMSLSTISTSIMLTVKPELNHKVSRHVAIAPIVHLDYSVSLTVYGIKVIAAIGFPDILFEALCKLYLPLVPILCSPFGIMPLCHINSLVVYGYSPGNYGACVGIIGAVASRGLSIQTLRHLYQIITKKQLMRYDYGVKENLKRYGTETPPIVDVGKITTPTSLVYSANDPLATPLNVALLARKMKTAKVVLLEDTMINHVDYFAAALFDNAVMKRVNRVILENIRLADIKENIKNNVENCIMKYQPVLKIKIFSYYMSVTP
uniref:Lipase n=1 Tax=Strigamia maritima TaxID=126957 RepID=T1JAE6_STRMM